MASPQTENGFTKIANEIIEHLASYRISGREWQILLVIIRKTYGFQKKSDLISMSQFAQLTGMKRSDVAEQIKKLSEKNIINVNKVFPKTLTGVPQNPNSKSINSYIFQKDWTLWKVFPKTLTGVPQNPNTLFPKTLTVGVPQNPTYKRKNTKETITKENALFVLPSFLDRKIWEDYLQMRKAIKKPATHRAMELIIEKLEKLQKDGDDPNEVLNQSILNSWQGVFPLNRNIKGKSHTEALEFTRNFFAERKKERENAE